MRKKTHDSYRATEPQNTVLEVGLALVVIYTNELPHLPLVTFLQSSHSLETKGN